MIFVISMINDETVHLPRFPFKINKQTNETRKKQKQRKNKEKQKKKKKHKKSEAKPICAQLSLYISLLYLSWSFYLYEKSCTIFYRYKICEDCNKYVQHFFGVHHSKGASYKLKLQLMTIKQESGISF